MKYVTGQDDVAVGHNLNSCTAELQVYRMNHPDGSGRRLVLVDTQGFDDDTIRKSMLCTLSASLLTRIQATQTFWTRLPIGWPLRKWSYSSIRKTLRVLKLLSRNKAVRVALLPQD